MANILHLPALVMLLAGSLSIEYRLEFSFEVKAERQVDDQNSFYIKDLHIVYKVTEAKTNKIVGEEIKQPIGIQIYQIPSNEAYGIEFRVEKIKQMRRYRWLGKPKDKIDYNYCSWAAMKKAFKQEYSRINNVKTTALALPSILKIPTIGVTKEVIQKRWKQALTITLKKDLTSTTSYGKLYKMTLRRVKADINFRVIQDTDGDLMLMRHEIFAVGFDPQIVVSEPQMEYIDSNGVEATGNDKLSI